MAPIQLTPYKPPGFASEIGIENLSMAVKPTCSGKILTDTRCGGVAIRIPAWTTDSWVRNLDLIGFNNYIDIEKFASRTTVTNIVMNRDGMTNCGAGYALDIAIGGSQVLIHDCTTRGAKNAKSYGVAIKTLAPGPNACIGYTAIDPVQSIEPHERWAHGFLNEGSKVAALMFRNRGSGGSGHGWAINNGVGWNVQASSLVIQNPPLGQNYCFGCTGPTSNEAGMTTNSTAVLDITVEPRSLFESQLKDRGFQFKL